MTNIQKPSKRGRMLSPIFRRRNSYTIKACLSSKTFTTTPNTHHLWKQYYIHWSQIKSKPLLQPSKIALILWKQQPQRHPIKLTTSTINQRRGKQKISRSFFNRLKILHPKVFQSGKPFHAGDFPRFVTPCVIGNISVAHGVKFVQAHNVS